MTELPESLRRRAARADPVDAIAAVIRDWNWDSYGLDMVCDADPEFAYHLAGDIVAALRKALRTHTENNAS